MNAPRKPMPIIRRARPGDAGGIAAVHVKSWRETYLGIIPDAHLASLSIEKRAEMWRGIIANATAGTNLPWVAVTADGEMVGFAASGPARSSEFDGYGELFAIYLLNAWKGLGVGKELFVRAKDDVVAGGFQKMMLWVLKDNPTLGFYLHHGGSVVSEKVEIIGGASLVESAVVWNLQKVSSKNEH